MLQNLVISILNVINFNSNSLEIYKVFLILIFF